MRLENLATTTALVAVLAFAGMPAKAQDWEYDLLIYGLGAGLDGTVGLGPIEAAADVGFSDLLDNLELGGMFGFRATRGDWAVMTDAVFVGLGASNGAVDVDVDELILDVSFTYRFTEFFELLFGARYVDIDANLAFRGPLGVTAAAGDSWVDPIVGIRLEGPMGDRWTFYGRLDVGGAGVGSDFSLNSALNFGYRFNDSSSLILGWRYLDFDYDDGEGLDRFKYDVATSGPMVGVAFHF